VNVRRVLACGVCLAAIVATGPAGVAQDWKPAAVASFDEVWATINETFPDPTFSGLDWAAVKAELRPAVQAAESPEAARAIIRQMLARLRRSHFVLMPAATPDAAALTGTATVPIEIRPWTSGVVITRVTPGSTAAEAGVTAGSTLLAVDDQPASSWMSAAQGATDRARGYDVWRRASRALHGPSDSAATLRLRAPTGEEREVRVRRVPEPGQVVQFGNLAPLRVRVETDDVSTSGGRRVGVIAFNYWMIAINADVDAAVDRFRRHDGLVFDLRGNPGGLAGMMTGIAGHVVATDALLGRMQARTVPLFYRVNPRVVTADGRRVTPFAGPVAIIVDELTASTSECFAGGLQSLGRARVFGRASAGQALPASTKRLPNGDVLMYAIMDFVTSTGRSIEGDGVVPDESQPLDPAALAAGRDTALEAALRWIDRERR
jgi:carboxyl-terminal processing protease